MSAVLTAHVLSPVPLPSCAELGHGGLYGYWLHKILDPASGKRGAFKAGALNVIARLSQYAPFCLSNCFCSTVKGFNADDPQTWDMHGALVTL